MEMLHFKGKAATLEHPLGGRTMPSTAILLGYGVGLGIIEN